MKAVAVLLLLAVSLCAFSGVLSIRERPNCVVPCNRMLKPVCGTWRRRGQISRCTFSNECMLGNARCVGNRDWQLTSEGECIRPTRDCDRLLIPKSG